VAVHLFVSADPMGFEGSLSPYDRLESFGPLDRAGLVGGAVRLFFVPVGQTIDYSFDALGVTTGAWAGPRAIGVGIVAVFSAITLAGLVRGHLLGFAGVWFAIFYVPHLGIVPWHEVFAERFLYLPSIGLAAGVAALWVGLWNAAGRWRWTTGLAACLCLTALAVATHERNLVWSSGRRLWSDAASKRPGSAKSQKGLGDELLMAGQPYLALPRYERAVEILPSYQDARVALVATLLEMRQLERARAELDDVLGRWPSNPRAMALEGVLHMSRGESGPAIEVFERVIRTSPDFGPAYVNLGRLYMESGELERARDMYERGTEFEASRADAQAGLTVLDRILGEGRGTSDDPVWTANGSRDSQR
jgi:Tfp pilus assembly protein PilF